MDSRSGEGKEMASHRLVLDSHTDVLRSSIFLVVQGNGMRIHQEVTVVLQMQQTHNFNTEHNILRIYGA